MHDKRRLTDGTLATIRLWSKRTTLQQEAEYAEEEGKESPFDNMSVTEIYLAGIRDGKTELANDILEAQDLINYN